MSYFDKILKDVPRVGATQSAAVAATAAATTTSASNNIKTTNNNDNTKFGSYTIAQAKQQLYGDKTNTAAATVTGTTHAMTGDTGAIARQQYSSYQDLSKQKGEITSQAVADRSIQKAAINNVISYIPKEEADKSLRANYDTFKKSNEAIVQQRAALKSNIAQDDLVARKYELEKQGYGGELISIRDGQVRREYIKNELSLQKQSENIFSTNIRQADFLSPQSRSTKYDQGQIVKSDDDYLKGIAAPYENLGIAGYNIGKAAKNLSERKSIESGFIDTRPDVETDFFSAVVKEGQSRIKGGTSSFSADIENIGKQFTKKPQYSLGNLVGSASQWALTLGVGSGVKAGATTAAKSLGVNQKTVKALTPTVTTSSFKNIQVDLGRGIGKTKDDTLSAVKKSTTPKTPGNFKKTEFKELTDLGKPIESSSSAKGLQTVQIARQKPEQIQNSFKSWKIDLGTGAGKADKIKEKSISKQIDKQIEGLPKQTQRQKQKQRVTYDVVTEFIPTPATAKTAKQSSMTRQDESNTTRQITKQLESFKSITEEPRTKMRFDTSEAVIKIPRPRSDTQLVRNIAKTKTDTGQGFKRPDPQLTRTRLDIPTPTWTRTVLDIPAKRDIPSPTRRRSTIFGALPRLPGGGGGGYFNPFDIKTSRKKERKYKVRDLVELSYGSDYAKKFNKQFGISAKDDPYGDF